MLLSFVELSSEGDNADVCGVSLGRASDTRYRVFCIHEIRLRLLLRPRTILHERCYYFGASGVSMAGYFGDSTLKCAELPYSLEKADVFLFFRKIRFL